MNQSGKQARARQELKPRHVPERSCIVCRTKRPKRELTRIVRTPEGEVKVDLTGRANGRGAYLCNDVECWVAGVSKGKLGHALNIQMTDEIKRDLLAAAGRPPAAGVPINPEV